MEKIESNEYRIECGSPTTVQTKLNQWRHIYWLTIHQMTTLVHSGGEVWVTVLIERRKKDEG